MFAKFYEIPSLPFQDIEKPKQCGLTDGPTDYATVYKKLTPIHHKLLMHFPKLCKFVQDDKIIKVW